MTTQYGCDRLAQFYSYLSLLARLQWDRSLQPKLDPSDLVQQTLLHARRSFETFRGRTDAELAGWLRQILANTLRQALRQYRVDKRSISRERSLEQRLDDSSYRLAEFAGNELTPSRHVELNERALRVAQAMEKLNPDQQEAIILHYWQGYTVTEVAELMQRSPSAVGGLVHRGLKKLRGELANLV